LTAIPEWKATLALAGVLAVACATGGSPGPKREPAQTALVGIWRLIRYADTPEGGAPVFAFGNPPVGLFVFTPEGYVSINLMRNPPAPDSASTDPDPDACLPAWYCSYFGTYKLDPAGGQWTTHVLGGNIPHYLGTDQRRSFVIRGDTLLIYETYAAGGRTVHAERVLVRAGNRP